MDNKTNIMQCAQELFYAKGYDAVGIQEIVDKAGITKPTLYYYFGSKYGLLQALLETKLEEMLVQMRCVVQEGGNIKTVLERMAEVHVGAFAKDRKFYMLTMALLYSARENDAYKAVHPYITELYQIVVQAFEGAAQQLGNMNGRQKQFAVGFLGTIHHYLLLCEAEDDGEFAKRKAGIIQSLVHQFMHGIFS